MDGGAPRSPWISSVAPEAADGRLAEVYRDVAGKRGRIAQVHAIQSLHPEALKAHMDLYLELMFARSPLSRCEREMIGVAVSRTNGCAYCVQHHAEALSRHERETGRIAAVREGQWEALAPREAAMCRYAEKLTLTPGAMTEADVDALRKAGLDDAGILVVAEVAAYFNFVNRLVLGLGVALEDPANREGFRY
jgi:uncharacterized peroxidase-related enzyme